MLIKNIELGKIICDEKNNVRGSNDYDSNDFKALKENIKALEKLTTPLLVKEVIQDQEYILLAGFRRFNAVKQLLDEAKTERSKKFWSEITCSIETVEDDKKEYKLKIAENFARKDMAQEEKAEIVYNLYEDEYKPSGKGWGSVAKDIGISIAYARKLYKIYVNTLRIDSAGSAQQGTISKVFDFAMTRDITQDIFRELEVYDPIKTETLVKLKIKEDIQDLIEQLQIKVSEITQEEDVAKTINQKRLEAIEKSRIEEYKKLIVEIQGQSKQASGEENAKLEKELQTVLNKRQKAEERLSKLITA